MKLTETGHVELCARMRTKEFWLSWGEAENDMSSTPENATDTALEDEVGRTMETSNKFVIPDGEGSITVGGQKWEPTASNGETPSKYLYLKFRFDEANNDSAVIRQMALYTDFDPTTPEDTYVNVEDVPGDKDQGTFVEHMNIADIVRDSATSESFDIIITY